VLSRYIRPLFLLPFCYFADIGLLIGNAVLLFIIKRNARKQRPPVSETPRAATKTE
jgi:hypothetical protein